MVKLTENRNNKIIKYRNKIEAITNQLTKLELDKMEIEIKVRESDHLIATTQTILNEMYRENYPNITFLDSKSTKIEGFKSMIFTSSTPNLNLKDSALLPFYPQTT